MSSQNSFLAKYSKSNAHNQEVQEKLESLNKEYGDLVTSFLISVGFKEFLDKGFTPKFNDDNRKYLFLIPLNFQLIFVQSWKSVAYLKTNSQLNLNEEERVTLHMYQAFFSIFKEEIENTICICNNKIVTMDDGNIDIDEVVRKIIIELLNEVEVGNKVEFDFPDGTDGLFAELLFVLATLRIYHHRNIFILNTKFFDFFPKFITTLRTGVFNGLLDFPYLVGKIFPEIIDTINEELDLDIAIENFEVLSQEEMAECMDLYKQALVKKTEEGKILLNDLAEIISCYEDNNSELVLLAKQPVVEQTTPKADNKASAAILKFFDSNSNTLVAKLKESGLQLSAAALQNDQNIARVANVVYNLLPGMVRIFVSYDTVENFLLNNRQWLINKLV